MGLPHALRARGPVNDCRSDSTPSTTSRLPSQFQILASTDGQASGAENQAQQAQQFLLTPARQLTLDGRAEPLVDVATQHAHADAPEPQGTYDAQASLFEWPQAELPLHPLVDGKANPECYGPRGGFKAKGDAHALHADGPRVTPQCCNRQQCASSAAGNDAERSRDRWNGTRRKGGGERIGMRHVVGDAALAVLVVTIPPHLRPSAREAKAQLQAWSSAAQEALCEVLREHVGHDDAKFWVRGDIHPCGENAKQWKPHLNFTVGGFAWLPSAGRGKRFNPHLDIPKLRAAMGRAQAQVFGEGENAGCHWQYHQGEGEKRHQAAYVPRTFPEWAHLKLRPTAYGLAHAKNRPALVEALATMKAKALPVWAHTELIDGLEPAPLTGHGSTEAEARADYDVQFHNHLVACGHCRTKAAANYPDYRRTMSREGISGGASPPSQGPPGPAEAAANAQWQRFMSLTA